MKAFFVDTLALLVFFTITGALNERFVAGMEWHEVAAARAIGAPLMVLTARPYARYRDALLAFGGQSRWSSQTLWDTLVLVTFQVPIYAFIIAWGGASGTDLIWGVGGAFVIMVVSGRPYGIWLDWLRSRFDLAPGEEKYMSLR